MTMRQRKRLLIGAAGVVGLASVAVLAGGLALPVAAPVSVPPPPIAATGTDAGGSPVGTDADAARRLAAGLEHVSRLDLRRPLYDPVTPPTTQAPDPASAARPKSPMTARLVGTVIEPGHSVAFFQMADGMVRLCREGGTLDDSGGPITVKRIDGPRVTVEYAGSMHELTLPEDEQ